MYNDSNAIDIIIINIVTRLLPILWNFYQKANSQACVAKIISKKLTKWRDNRLCYFWAIYRLCRLANKTH